MTESQLTEQADYTKAGGGTPGDDFIGEDGQLIISVPEANYPSGKTCTALDTDLVAGNIKDGVNIFGVAGTHAPLTGDNILGDDGDPTIPIPAANYPSGKICTAQDADLVAGNIKNAVTIFGVEGSYVTPETAFIQSIQYGLVSLAGAATNHTHINQIDTNNSILFSLGQNGDASPGNTGAARLVLTDSTTITATRNTTAAALLNVGFMVVEFAKGVKSVQQGAVTIANAAYSGTAAINAVVIANSVLSLLGFSSTDTNAVGFASLPMITLTNTTTITAERRTNTGVLTVAFMILEFD